MSEMKVPAESDSPGVIALPPLLYGVAFALVLILRWLWPLPVLRQAWAFWLGIALLALGGGIAFWGQRAMRAAGTNVNPTKPATALVTSGPFRFSRNPLYLALTLLFLGLSLAVNTWWGFIVLGPLLLLMHKGVILREERYLEQKFGESYRQYSSSVRRYL
jgi:protein-S-isoprenylcysteine O-methyltransferase Ste14